MAIWDQFEQVTAEVDHIRPDGVGYINHEGGLVEIGDINTDYGSVVDVALISKTQGVCLTKSAVSNSYENYKRQVIKKYNLRDRLADGSMIPGEEFSAEVISIDASGMGKVRTPFGDEVNIGPIECEIGAEVELEFISEGYARCLDATVQTDNYESIYGTRVGSGDSHLKSGDKFSAEVTNINNNGIGLVRSVFGERLHIGPVTCDIGRLVQLEFVCEGYARCIDESVQADSYDVRFYILAGQYDQLPISIGENYIGEVVLVHDESVTVSHNDIHVHISENGLAKGDKVLFQVTDFASQSANGELVEIKEPADTSSSSREPTDSERLQNLRKQAENQSQSSVDSSQTQNTVKQYSRSSAVKQYAKARANGICEGCGSSAPFVDQNGEPYLQVHHLEELSNGGADAPENVACLCPNCHYRIHHGKDGEEFNNQIADEIDSIES